MKLLNYNTTRFSLILFLLLSIWAVVFYFQMNDEIYDSLDEGLENQKDLLVQKIQHDDLNINESIEDKYSNISEISLEQADNFDEIYKDTLLYIESEDDYEPVRLLQDVFEHDGSYYIIEVSTSMVEEDDLIQSLLFSLLWLYFGLILSILILNNLFLKKLWRPFYVLLSRLKTFNIETDEQIELEDTRIEEFSLLNEHIGQLLQKSVESYRGQKHFIENASHELQTPLAISINKLELLVENNGLKDEQLEIVGSVLNNLERLTRLNKSLLLLSKIENKQFLKMEEVNFNELIKQSLTDFEDLAAHLNTEVILTESGAIHYNMNPDLALILVSNLVKNALVHGPKGKAIEIQISQRKIDFRNQGNGTPLKEELLFSRFQSAGKEGKSTGLGLAISKAIASRFDLNLSYSFQDAHIFRINFPIK